MQLQSSHREALLHTLKETIKESNQIRKNIESFKIKLLDKSNEFITEETILRTEIDLHLSILKIGMIETILIENQIDL